VDADILIVLMQDVLRGQN